jgi:hypothetical protein
VEHLRRGRPALAAGLKAGAVWCRPSVIGELACGHLQRRAALPLHIIALELGLAFRPS